MSISFIFIILIILFFFNQGDHFSNVYRSPRGPCIQFIFQVCIFALFLVKTKNMFLRILVFLTLYMVKVRLVLVHFQPILQLNLR